VVRPTYMRSVKIQLFLISIVTMGSLGAAIAFAIRSFSEWAIVGISLGAGALVGLVTVALLPALDETKPEESREPREDAPRNHTPLPESVVVQHGIAEVLSKMSDKFAACQGDLERKSRDFDFLVDFSKMMTTTPSEGKLLPFVLEKIAYHVGAKSASFLLLDKRSKELVARAVTGSAGGLARGECVPTDEGIYAQVLGSKRTVIQRRGVRSRALARIATPGDPEDVVGVPLQVDNRMLGILMVEGKKDGTGFTHGESEFLGYLANGTAMVLRYASLQEELTKIFLSIVRALVQAVDARDRYTRNHSTRVSEYSMALGRALKFDPDEQDRMLFGSLLHDIGKLGIPDHILNKPGKLTDEEFEVIKSHTVRGSEILGHLETRLPWNILPLVRSHHERWDGTGYPDRLQGASIDRQARVVAIADVFDAITSDRVYRPGMPLDQAIMEIRRGVGHHFDPNLVPVATSLLETEYKRVAESIGLG